MKKLRHNHTLTDFLKFGIFAILLLMPILIFVPNAFYYGFNEHAVAQEKTEQVPVYYESNEVNTYQDLVIGNVYNWSNHLDIVDTDRLINIFNVTILSGTYTGVTGDIFLSYNDYGVLYLSYGTSTNIRFDEFDFIINSFGSNYQLTPQDILDRILVCNTHYLKEYTSITTNMSITDSMSYAWDSVWQNDLFSWTSNNGIYTVINNMNTTIGIPSQARLANYLTYITLFTVIYVIIDIIIGTFTMLTHLFNKEPK